MKKGVLLKLAFGVMVSLFLGGCGVGGGLVDSRSSEWSFETRVGASEGVVDMGDPAWMDKYCKRRIMEVAAVPVEFERRRGPFKSMDPVRGEERLAGASEVATCNTDFYWWPVAKEAFGDMGIEYAYSEAVWEEFHQAVAASVSAKLVNDGWVEVESVDQEMGADLSLVNWRAELGVREYLDLFFTKDEEVVFELVVVKN